MPATGQRGAHKPNPGNLTGSVFYQQQRQRQAELKQAEAQKRAAALVPDLTPQERVNEIQLTLKTGRAVWDADLGDVTVDYTSGGR